MRNEIVISKMLIYVKKVSAYIEGMDYDTFIKMKCSWKPACLI